MFLVFRGECHVAFFYRLYASLPNDEVGKDGVLTRHVHTCLSIGSLDFESVFFEPRFRSDTNNCCCLKSHIIVYSPPIFLMFFHSGWSAAPEDAVMARTRRARAP